MKITFWKDNLLTGEHQVDVEKIVGDFLKKCPDYHNFERELLLFMMDSYGSFDRFTDEQWDTIDAERRKTEQS